MNKEEGKNNTTPSELKMDDDLGWQLRLAYYVVAPPVVLFIFASNILLLVLIFRNNKLRCRTNVGVASWAACDILIGLVLLAQVIFMGIRNLTVAAKEPRLLQKEYEQEDYEDEELESGDTLNTNEARAGSLILCIFWASLQLLPVVVSCLHWVGLALDRFVAIMDAVHYEQRVTCQRVKSGVIAVWLYGLLWSLLPFVWHTNQTSLYGDQFCNFCVVLAKYYLFLLILLHFVPCLLITVALFVRMFVHVRAHQRQVHVTHTMTQDKLLEDFVVARSYLMVFLASVIFWSPFFIGSLVGVFKDFPSELQTAVSACMLIGVLASAVKFPIYILANKDFMKAFKDLYVKGPLPPSRHRY